MTERLEGTVLVTGAAGGIGSEVAAILERRGCRVIAADLAADAPCREPIALDVTDDAAVAAAVEAIAPLDGLVLAHGLTSLGPAVGTSVEAVRKVIEVNLLGAISVATAALPGLIERSGRIAVMSSVAGFAPLVHRTAYSASKHGLHGWFESLDAEQPEVSVTMVAPSFTATGIEDRAVHRAEGDQGSWSTTGEILQAIEVAEAVVGGMDERAPLVLPSKTSRRAHRLHRLAPKTYRRVMRRRVLGE